MDVAQSLQELRAVVEKARSLPMSTSAVINRTEGLANPEISLNKPLEAVTRGRDRLQNRSGLDQLDEADDDTPFPFAD